MKRLALLAALLLAAAPARAELCSRWASDAFGMAHQRNLGRTADEERRRAQPLLQNQSDYGRHLALMYFEMITDLYEHPQITPGEASEMALEACGWVPLRHLHAQGR